MLAEEQQNPKERISVGCILLRIGFQLKLF